MLHLSIPPGPFHKLIRSSEIGLSKNNFVLGWFAIQGLVTLLNYGIITFEESLLLRRHLVMMIKEPLIGWHLVMMLKEPLIG